jgi:acyl-coenzyme A synthetase/AMP-(fatty) acid ligase/3-hydroxymyristoyl/3-hydroxydecanoyl-(acyl carrier protein) dehydratase
MNVLFFGAFGLTLLHSPSMIYRFAILQDKSISGSLGERGVAAYCRKVTVVWMVFFVFNGSVAAWTIFSGSDVLWSVYNGGISYILIGTLFAGEFIVRKKVQKKMPKAVPLSALTVKSRDTSAVLCYEGIWSKGVYHTWGDFLDDTAKLRRRIEAINNGSWLLYCEDSWFFLLAFVSLLQCKKEILLSANVSPAYIKEIRGSAPFLTDQVFSDADRPENTFDISALLSQEGAQTDPQINADKLPAINGDETSIIMFTSGTTGTPKTVRQRLTEFENDNRFILSKWGEEFLSRKLCSTVSQHHIYGLLFSILLPFTAGVPFRRERIKFPEELEKFTDTEYMIITVPAFLKRGVQIESSASLGLKSPWIFTSGGVLDRKTAQKTAEIFGFWPLEVYGSTETSGIAFRQSYKGPEWTAFDNAQLSQNEEGCLVIRSPYIKDKAGFETADLVELLGNGQFLLKGRIDSVVKIEEKRISLTEVEGRILESGLVSQVCVIPLTDKRQYLVAALVLNDKGKEQFVGLEKYAINSFWKKYLLQYFENMVIPRKWRYPQMLPMDAQGKIKREDVHILFADEYQISTADAAPKYTGFDGSDKAKVIEKTEKSVIIEFLIPATSPYFDGHFPEFSILPAVAQVELVLRFASEYFGASVAISELKRIKFTNFIRPNAHLVLRLEKGDKTIIFKLSSPKGDVIYSIGTLVFPLPLKGRLPSEGSP